MSNFRYLIPLYLKYLRIFSESDFKKMKHNSHSFNLIKTLTMSEKRYFKIFSERHTIGKQNKYVVLFDTLDKAETEDDVAIKKQLKKLKINPDFISADKNYLYNLILRSLNDFHDSRTMNMEVKELLMSVEILFYKGLYYECLKLIHKTEKLAAECENFQLMMDVLMWKKKCAGYSTGLQSATKINNEIEHYLKLLNTLKQITNLYYQSYQLLVKEEKQIDAKTINEFESILKKTQHISKENTLSFYALIFYHLIYANYYSVTDNRAKEFKQLQELINMLNISKTYAIENPFDYVSIYNRFLALKKYFDAKSFFNDIKILTDFTKKIYINAELISQRVFVHTQTHELEYYIITNDFFEAQNLIRKIEKNAQKSTIEIEPYHIIYFYYMYVVIMIFAGQFHKALKFVNKILNDFNLEDRPQVYIRMGLLNTLVHYELKNNSLVGSFAAKLLKENNKYHILLPVEEKLLETLVKLSKTSNYNIKEENLAFQKLIAFINQEKQQTNFSVKQLIENYHKWLMAKLKREHVWNN